MSETSGMLRYVLLPQILPRAWELFASGFAHIPLFMAIIYQGVGLLPRGHPYLNPQNAGRFGIRHVIAQAANNLVLDRKHIDQVAVFFLILAAATLLIGQFLLFLLALIAHQPVLAGIPAVTPSFNELLSITSTYRGNPQQDIAFIILDRVFGMRDIFNSCVSSGVACVDLRGNPLPSGAYPSPFHIALHAMLRFYSLGIFVVSVFIIIYFIVTTTAETAATGKAFGKRYNKTWAPVRLILFAALLVPLNIGGNNQGLNAAQIIVMWSAKLGSNFATNAWNRFNSVLTESYLGQANTLVATPTAPDINSLAQFMFTVKACQVAETFAYEHEPDGIQAYVVRTQTAFNTGVNHLDFRSASFDAARKFASYGTVFVRFGVQDDKRFQSYAGGVKPFCGEVRIPIVSMDKFASAPEGATAIQALYYDMVKEMWVDSNMRDFAECLRSRLMSTGQKIDCSETQYEDFKKAIVTKYQNYLETNLAPLIAQQFNRGDWLVPVELRDKGWAGAAIWYNRVAQLNGDVATALLNLPQPTIWPFVMDLVAKSRARENESLGSSDIFNPSLAGGTGMDYPRARDREIATIENAAWTLWGDSGNYRPHFSSESGDLFKDGINAMLGTNGIYEMRRNPDIHPLAQLSALGKGLMEAALRNLMLGTGLSVGSGLADTALGNFVGSLVKIAGSLLYTLGMMTILIGFILYYVLPFMPFMYFFFAVMAWVKAIFEAVVAMPLWALAHIRIDGEGMSGPAASSGYFLIFEIFLRPILIVAGLLASVQLFSALVMVLNDTFEIVVANVGGFNDKSEISVATADSKIAFKRGALDEFFLTCLYAIMCYMMGLGCFKLIDYVPNTILRWAGVTVSPLTSRANENAGQLIEQTYQGGSLLTQKLDSSQLTGLLVLGKSG